MKVEVAILGSLSLTASLFFSVDVRHIRRRSGRKSEPHTVTCPLVMHCVSNFIFSVDWVLGTDR